MSSQKQHEPRKRRLSRSRRAPQGSVPGTIVPDPEARPTALELFEYDAASVRELKHAQLSDVPADVQPGRVLWINVTGLANADLIAAIGRRFGLHKLALEDVMHTHQRPKVEEYGDHLYLVLLAPEHSDAAVRVQTEQISLFVLKGAVITFQEGASDCFDGVRDRIRRAIGRIRESGADYLSYALIDASIDGFFPVTERVGTEVEELEDTHANVTGVKFNSRLYELRHELMRIRRAVWPMRDMTNALIRDEHGIFAAETRIHLRDCHDHCVQLMDLVESHREILAALMEMQLSQASYRMNEVMKVLTIIATLFMPMTFIVGVYGMNFNTAASSVNMPELGWKYGYIFSLGLCGASAVLLLTYFKRKRWL